jgi:hypothetical protein
MHSLVEMRIRFDESKMSILLYGEFCVRKSSKGKPFCFVEKWQKQVRDSKGTWKVGICI